MRFCAFSAKFRSKIIYKIFYIEFLFQRVPLFFSTFSQYMVKSVGMKLRVDASNILRLYSSEILYARAIRMHVEVSR